MSSSTKREFAYTDNWLQPTGEQERLLRQWAGMSRFVWNRALSIESARYRRGEKKLLGVYAMKRELTQWREVGRDTEFLREAPVHVLQNVLWDLYGSYDRFFKKSQEKPPQFRKKSKSHISVTETDAATFEIDYVNHRLKFPKLGWINCRFPREIIGKANAVTIRFDGKHWIASVQVSVEIKGEPIHPNRSIVAGDLGVVQRVTWSDGTITDAINVLWEEKRVAFYQRQLKNKKKFSKNWLKVQTKIRKLHRRIANIRKDATNKTTTDISKNHAIVVLGDLDVKNMSASAKGTKNNPGKNVRQKSGLNRSILRQGWFAFGRQLVYKLAWRGGELVRRSEAYTSQTCPKCDHINKSNRVSQAKFVCQNCGLEAHADLVGATNQLIKFLESEKGKTLLASGYRASANSLWSPAQLSGTTKQEPAEGIAA